MPMKVDEVSSIKLVQKSYETIELYKFLLFLLDSPGEQNISIVLNGIESELQFVKMGVENRVSSNSLD